MVVLLGTYAIYNFWNTINSIINLWKKNFFFESTDPVNLNGTLSQINLEDTLFIVISKSGTTIETISVFKYLMSITKLINQIF